MNRWIGFVILALTSFGPRAHGIDAWEQRSLEKQALAALNSMLDQSPIGPKQKAFERDLKDLERKLGSGQLSPASYSDLIKCLGRGGLIHYKAHRLISGMLVRAAKEGWLSTDHIVQLLPLAPTLTTSIVSNEATQATAMIAYRRGGHLGADFNEVAVSTLERLQLLDHMDDPHPHMKFAVENIFFSLDPSALEKTPELRARLEKWLAVNPRERFEFLLAGQPGLVQSLSIVPPAISQRQIHDIASRRALVRNQAVRGANPTASELARAGERTAEMEEREIVRAIERSRRDGKLSLALKTIADLEAQALAPLRVENQYSQRLQAAKQAMDSLSSEKSPQVRDALIGLVRATDGKDPELFRLPFARLVRSFSEDPQVQRLMADQINSSNQRLRVFVLEALDKVTLDSPERAYLQSKLSGFIPPTGVNVATVESLRRKAAVLGPKPAGNGTGCVIDFSQVAKNRLPKD